MLEEIDIRNFAVTEHVRIRFTPGFNAITGETGAGKSIIIDALGLLLGERADPALVRAGTASARVEGLFRISDAPDTPLSEALAEAGIEPEDGLLIVSREVPRQGRSVARINGRAVVQSTLSALGRRLVDIHGQTDQLSILRPAEHLGYLDRFAGLLDRRAAVAALVTELREVRGAIRAIHEDEREHARRQDRLQYEVQEIDDAQLRTDEEDELRAERQLLANAEELARLSDAAHAALTEGGRTASAVDALGVAAEALAQLARLDERLTETATLAESLQSQVYDLARDLRSYREGVEYNPSRLQQIEERLGLLAALRRKYGDTIADVIAYGERARDELGELLSSDERLEQLRARERELVSDLGAAAEKLSRARREAAVSLVTAVQREIADLRLAGGRFAVRLERHADPHGVPVALPPEDMVEAGAADMPNTGLLHAAFDRTGVDRVEFYVSLNPGEPLRPLAKVASGGETARLMLALKTILGAADAVPTLVFDEVDVGIGGRSGQIVGEKLAALGAHHQVVCITHLPQVAARAGNHLVVVKHVEDGRTYTDVRGLAGLDRTHELAAMLGGITDSHIAAAAEMLAQPSASAPDLRFAKVKAAPSKRGGAPPTPNPQSPTSSSPSSLCD
ncbi:MAG: DNA repair protein RecN [Chloroflexi bacterium]|nr:DNA repair protein RecN [Chloroflexota bacterium]